MTATCEFCRQELPDGATKCPHCGEWTSAAAKSKAQRFSPIQTVIFVLFAALVVVAVMALV